MLALAQSPAARPVVTAFPSLKIPASSRGLAYGGWWDRICLGESAAVLQHCQIGFHTEFSPGLCFLYAVADRCQQRYEVYECELSRLMFPTVLLWALLLSYLSLGNMATRDDNGATLANYHASEYNLMGCYALQVADKASLGVGVPVSWAKTRSRKVCTA
jgi:hypothetical protein